VLKPARPSQVKNSDFDRVIQEWTHVGEPHNTADEGKKERLQHQQQQLTVAHAAKQRENGGVVLVQMDGESVLYPKSRVFRLMPTELSPAAHLDHIWLDSGSRSWSNPSGRHSMQASALHALHALLTSPKGGYSDASLQHKFQSPFPGYWVFAGIPQHCIKLLTKSKKTAGELAARAGDGLQGDGDKSGGDVKGPLSSNKKGGSAASKRKAPPPAVGMPAGGAAGQAAGSDTPMSVPTPTAANNKKSKKGGGAAATASAIKDATPASTKMSDTPMGDTPLETPTGAAAQGDAAQAGVGAAAAAESKKPTTRGKTAQRKGKSGKPEPAAPANAAAAPAANTTANSKAALGPAAQETASGPQVAVPGQQAPVSGTDMSGMPKSRGADTSLLVADEVFTTMVTTGLEECMDMSGLDNLTEGFVDNLDDDFGSFFSTTVPTKSSGGGADAHDELNLDDDLMGELGDGLGGANTSTSTADYGRTSNSAAAVDTSKSHAMLDKSHDDLDDSLLGSDLWDTKEVSSGLAPETTVYMDASNSAPPVVENLAEKDPEKWREMEEKRLREEEEKDREALEMVMNTLPPVQRRSDIVTLNQYRVSLPGMPYGPQRVFDVAYGPSSEPPLLKGSCNQREPSEPDTDFQSERNIMEGESGSSAVLSQGGWGLGDGGVGGDPMGMHGGLCVNDRERRARASRDAKGGKHASSKRVWSDSRSVACYHACSRESMMVRTLKLAKHKLLEGCGKMMPVEYRSVSVVCMSLCVGASVILCVCLC
jgi:hypothetical protein